MKRVTSLLLVIKPGHDRAVALAAEMQAWLLARRVQAVTLVHPAMRPECADILCEAARDADAVVVLGGDGTFISVARQLAGRSVPLLGINFGHLGFLTETPAKHWRSVLRRLLAGTLCCMPRTTLCWTMERDGKPVASGNAINDVVVSRGKLARVATLHLSVGSRPACADAAMNFDGGDLGWIRADGVIVASPLGSSAYSLSARGPLVHPDLSSLLVTAVAPFLNSVPPLVLPGDSCVRLQCEPGCAADAEVCLTVDGQEGYGLCGGDTVTICGRPGGMDMLVPHPASYFQTLRGRGFIREFWAGAATGKGSDLSAGGKREK